MILLQNIDILHTKKGFSRNLNIAIKDSNIIDIFPSNLTKNEYSDFNHINCQNLTAVPSFVDIHSHLREPGFEYKETIESGANAAKSGGFTDICCMANTSPVVDNEEVVKYILSKSASTGISVYPIAAITKGLKGESLTEFGHLVDAGVVAFSDDGSDVNNSFLMKSAFEYANFFNKPIFCHSEDQKLSANGVMNEGYYSMLAGLHGNPSISEEVAVFRNIKIAEYTGARVHICHVSSRGSVALINQAKKSYGRITAESAPHYTYLTDKDVYQSDYNTNFKINPPIRGEADRYTIIEGLRDDTIDCIATDHAPHAEHEKEVEFDKAPFGAIGFETAFPVCYQMVINNKLTIEKLISKMSIEPAKIIGIEKNEIELGEVADITIINLQLEKVYKKEEIYSKSKNSPFIDSKFKGWVVATICKGRIVYNIIK